jgi:outer membrane lipoprotein-sorting protein
MKRVIFVFAGLLLFTLINAQSLNEIVKKYSAANKYDNLSALSSIKITGKMSMMGMDMPYEMWMKNPNKMKTISNFQGQDIISVFDGVKGYNISPMTGSADPVEMTPEQVKQALKNNIFQNSIVTYMKEGKLTLDGEEKVNDRPAFKIKAKLEEGDMVMYLDKESYLLQKTTLATTMNGTPMTVEMYMTDYKETNGIILPMKTSTSAGGMDFAIIFEKVEVNIPMDDSIFKIK